MERVQVDLPIEGTHNFPSVYSLKLNINSGIEESSRPRQSHKLEIAGANPASATRTMRVSYSGNTSAFQADARSSILLTRSKNMLPVIEENSLIRKFNFSSLVTKQDDFEACEIIKRIIADGNYFTNSPKFQTKENIFGRSEAVWLKYRMSFLFSVFMYLGREVKVGNMMAWSFMTNLEGAEDREKLWHDHWHPTNPNAKMMSGIWYLHIPEDVRDRDYCGTEIAPNGVHGDGKFFVRPNDGHWLIYPSNTWHRPGIVQSNQYRFVLAADIEYI